MHITDKLTGLNQAPQKDLAREELEKALLKDLVEVTFRKVNGEVRIMTCTKNLKHVPPSQWPNEKLEEENVRTSNIRVWDINAKGWRSFVFKNVITTEIANSDQLDLI